MRDLFSKIMTGSMVASAALLVAACGGSETAEATNNVTEMDTTDAMMDGTTNDVTAVDGAMADGNLAVDANATDLNASNTVETNTTNAM